MILIGTVTVLPMENFVAIVIVSIALITWSMKKRGVRPSRYVYKEQLSNIIVLSLVHTCKDRVF